MGEYKVQFEVFEGPLDLLLYLVKKEEVDVYEVNLTRLATQFIAYIELMRQLDLEIAGDFLVMASTLMYIKSRELLPTDQQVEAEGEEEEDPRWELIRQLVEYKKFKDAAGQLQSRELEQEGTFPRTPARPDPAGFASSPRTEASLFDLISAVGQVLKRVQEREGPREIYEDPWTVSEKIEHLRRWLKDRSRVRFSELFAQTTTRSEVVATFLALLELVRLKIVAAVQSEAFGEIDLERVAAPEPAASPEASSSPDPQPGSASSA
jgi:segregation and condensation protein A